jgi:hypothetical protein
MPSSCHFKQTTNLLNDGICVNELTDYTEMLQYDVVP